MAYDDCEAKFEDVCDGETVAVLLDENMETFMCKPCIQLARTEMSIEIMEGY